MAKCSQLTPLLFKGLTDIDLPFAERWLADILQTAGQVTYTFVLIFYRFTIALFLIKMSVHPDIELHLQVSFSFRYFVVYEKSVISWSANRPISWLWSAGKLSWVIKNNVKSIRLANKISLHSVNNWTRQLTTNWQCTTTITTLLQRPRNAICTTV